MNRRIVLIAVAVVLALAGTVAVYSYAHNADKRAVADGRAVTVLVATKRVAAGTTWADAVKSGTMAVQNMPAGSTPASALSGLDSNIAGSAVAQSDIAPGQIVLRQSWGAAVSDTGVLAIPKGDIAITVSLSSDNDVAGYVAPHSQVIIFATGSLKANSLKTPATAGSDLTMTRTVVPRAMVIATSAASPTNTVASNSSAGSSSNNAVLVTLALSQSDAERVINQKSGTLTLGLLSPTSVVTQDGGYVNATGVSHIAPVWVN